MGDEFYTRLPQLLGWHQDDNRGDAALTQWSEDLIPIERARTLDGLFYQRVRRSPGRVAYRYFDRGTDAWCELTWAEVGDLVARWRAALAREAVYPGDRVGILLRNCPEWVIFDQAALSLGLVTVPLYTDDRADSAAYIIQDAAIKVLLVQDGNRWGRISEALGESPYPVRVVLMDAGRDGERLTVNDECVVVATDWVPPKAPDLEQREGDPQALATIVYTSGTTGRPKGVMLSHRNLLFNAHASLTMVDCYQEDLFLSFLPLSHTLERTAGYYLPILAGCAVAYARSIAQLADDLRQVRPTGMFAVPRVFERVYQRIMDQVKGRPARSAGCSAWRCAPAGSISSATRGAAAGTPCSCCGLCCARRWPGRCWIVSVGACASPSAGGHHCRGRSPTCLSGWGCPWSRATA